MPGVGEQARGSDFSPAEEQRYARQLMLPGFGAAAQQRLSEARVLVVGAGGLGSPVSYYLAAAGVGRLTIVDGDVVESSNLQRQVLHREADLGTPKALSAARALCALNSHITVDAYAEYLSRENAVDLCEQHDVVVDCADNFAARYLLADAAEITGTVVVWAAVQEFEGQLSVFWPGRGPGLRDIYPDIPTFTPPKGVLGALPGIVGAAQAAETIKVITGVGEPAVGRLMLFNTLAGTQRVVRVQRDPRRAAVRQLAAEY